MATQKELLLSKLSSGKQLRDLLIYEVADELGVKIESVRRRLNELVTERRARYEAKGDKLYVVLCEDNEPSGLMRENERLKQEVTRLVRERQVTSYDFAGDVIRFGSVSDTHLGSMYENLTLLNSAYDVFEREGITKVFHTGDLTDGENMYRGQVYELHIHGCDAQRDYCIQQYPRRAGIDTEYIIGNHDGAFWKNAGVDVGLQIGDSRADMHYLGMDEADVTLKCDTGEITLRLLHPRKGTSYALSYQCQKYIESLTGGHKPNMLCFVAGTSIVRGDGTVSSIEDINIGDAVITHTGQQQLVTAVFERDEVELVEIRAYGIPKYTLKSSPEHPYWVLRDGVGQWVEASCITKADWIGRPICSGTKEIVLDFSRCLQKHFYRIVDNDDMILGTNGKEYDRYISVTADFCRLLGLLVAEGYADKPLYRLNVALHQDENEYTEFIQRVMFSLFGAEGHVVDREESLTRVLRFNDLYASDFFATLMGRGASNKCFPSWVLRLPVDMQFELLRGLFQGDGCKSKWYYELSTISRNLVEQVLIISARVGLAAGYSAQTRRDVGRRPEYTVRVHHNGNVGTKWYDSVIINQTTKKKLIYNDGDYVWHKVYAINNEALDKPVKVYNLEVDKDESYLASSIAVHNCVGHYHKQEYLFYRNIHCTQNGCVQHQTPFMRGRNLAAMQGFWIVELTVNDKGIARCKTEWFPCYD